MLDFLFLYKAIIIKINNLRETRMWRQQQIRLVQVRYSGHSLIDQKQSLKQKKVVAGKRRLCLKRYSSFSLSFLLNRVFFCAANLICERRRRRRLVRDTCSITQQREAHGPRSRTSPEAVPCLQLFALYHSFHCKRYSKMFSLFLLFCLSSQEPIVLRSLFNLQRK